MGSTSDTTTWGPHGSPSLPIEVWGEITICLPIRDAITLSRVNRLFYHAFIDNIYYRHIKYDETASTPLRWAVAIGQLTTAQRALGQGADPNAAVSHISKELPLYIAITAGVETSMVKLLLDYGADPLYICDGRTHIELAIIEGNNTALELLLDAEHSYYGTSEATSRLPSCAVGRISRHANCTTIDGATVLHVAARSGHPDAVRALIQYGARVNARDSTGDTALHLAINMGNLQAVEILIKSGADVSLRDFIHHHNALDRAVTAFADQSTQTDHYNPAASEDPTHYTPDASGTLACVAKAVYGNRFSGSWYSIDEAQIHDWLISFSSFIHVEIVCDLSKNVDAKSRQGVTPLWVMSGGDPSKHKLDTWVKTLLDFGADINFKAPGSGMTPLMRAVQAKNLRLMILFHEHGGCDVLAEDNAGRTGLDWARRVGFEQCAKMLENCMKQARVKNEAV